MKLKRKSISGFTLIETIVAFAIIAIILVVALAGFNTIANVGSKAQAWNVADQEMEVLIASGTGYEASENMTLEFTITGADGLPAIDPATGNPLVIKIEGKILTYDNDGKRLSVFQPN